MARTLSAKSPTHVDPDADETTCEKCDATIEIGEETIVDAVVRHYRAEHGLGE